MRSKISVFFFLSVMLFVFAESTMRVRKFVKSQAVLDRTGFSKAQSTRSKIQCAAACEQDDICQKYSYENNTCWMGQSASGSSVLYKLYDNCPADRGYSLWAYDDMQLCLKYNPSVLNHLGAEMSCENDGGHLVLMESLAAKGRINEVLTELGATGLVWLDGYDPSATNLFLSWRGEPLTWIDWAAGNPEDLGGDHCLCGSSVDDYKHRDVGCHQPMAVLCQIDTT